MPSLVEIGTVVWRRRGKCEIYDNNDEEDGQWKILIRKAHVSLKCLKWQITKNQFCKHLVVIEI